MPYMIRHLTLFSALALMAGCTQQEVKPTVPAIDSSRNPEILSPDLYPNGSKADDAAPVRYGRYTLVNTAPENEQRDLMAQIIDVNIPGNMHPQVHDAMLYVVDRSGYSLCPDSTDHVSILYTRPLPAAQYKLGPMTLRNTLQVLAGPAWQVKVNEVTRQVCFVLRSGYQIPDMPRPIAPIGSPTAIASAASKPSSSSTPSPVVVSIPAAAPAVTVAAAPAQPIASSPSSTGTPHPTPSSTAKPASPEQQPSVLAKDRPVAAATSSTPVKPAPISTTATPVVATTMPSGSATAPITSAAPIVQPAKPIVAPAPVATWDAEAGSTLRQTVEAWAKKANWQLIWGQADLDYPIEASLHFRGSFPEAISQIFPLYDSARRSFAVDGNTAQRIVYVSERKKL